MFHDNLLQLRKINNLSQEALAERLEVSRQTLSKWETGDSLPDISRCKQLADIFGVSVDELISYEPEESGGLGLGPKGKHAFGIVTVGDKGQIVIPTRARKIFHISPGDRLLVLGDEEQGIAIIKADEFLELFTNPFHKK